MSDTRPTTPPSTTKPTAAWLAEQWAKQKAYTVERRRYGRAWDGSEEAEDGPLPDRLPDRAAVLT